MESRIKNVKFRDRLFRGRTLLYLLMFMFCLGEIVGTLICIAPESFGFSAAESFLSRFFHNRLGCTFIQTVVNSFSGTFILMLCCMILGFSAVSQPIEALVPFFHGLGIGTVLAEMNSSFGIKGLAVSAVMILPFAVISAFAVIISAREAIMMSSAVGKNTFGIKDHRDIDVKLYITKFLVLFSAAALSSLLDGLMTYLFAGLWTSILEI